MLATCNNCGKILTVKLQKKKHPNNIEETYFECESCYYHYTSFVTDKKVRKLQEKKEQLKGNTHINKRLDIQEEINAQMAKLKDNLIRFGRADL